MPSQSTTVRTPPRDVVAPCSMCGGDLSAPLLVLDGVPVLINELWPTEVEARTAARGDIALARCDRCGLIRNRAFDPGLVTYSPRYENSLHFSPRFQDFATSVARRLVDRFDVHGGTVVEIGAGQGDFLRLLRDAGVATVRGYDPAAHGDGDVRSGSIDEVDTASVDLVVCRHVLEHVDDPRAFLRGIGDRFPGAAFYFEVPNAAWMLERGGVWDVIYEHCSYFTPEALRAVLDAEAFHCEAVRPVFGDQFVAATGRITESRNGAPPTAGRQPPDLAGFAARAKRFVKQWDQWLHARYDEGAAVALWGAGSKGSTFLNLVPAAQHLAAVVDVNPRKHGTWVPGTGHRVDAPPSLPDVATVLVTNPAYLEEVRQSLEDLGRHADVRAV